MPTYGKKLSARLHRYEADGIAVMFYPLRRQKVADELWRKVGYQTDDSFRFSIADKVEYEDASQSRLPRYTTLYTGRS